MEIELETQKMIEKKHPTFYRRLTVLFVIVFSFTLVLFFNLAGYLGPKFLPEGLQIGMAFVNMFGFVIYGFWAGSHVKCPQCSSRCERYSDELNEGRKALCRHCSVIWDLGITFNSD